MIRRRRLLVGAILDSCLVGWCYLMMHFVAILLRKRRKYKYHLGVRFFTVPLHLIEVQDPEAFKKGSGDTSALEVRGPDQGQTNIMVKPRPLPSSLLLSPSSPVCLPHDSVAL